MGTRSEPRRKIASRSLNAYYNASQLRADTWNQLKSLTARLERDPAGGAKLGEQIEQAFDTLEPIEAYWAFPGRDAFYQLRRAFERQEYATLSRAVARTVRALMSNAYRRKTIPLGLNGDSEDEEEEALEAKDEHLLARPYFEVLIVDSLNLHQEHMLRLGLREMRRREDAFIYEAVVVPSFEDALVGVLFNHNIQAVVIRYGFPFEAQHTSSRCCNAISRESAMRIFRIWRRRTTGSSWPRLLASFVPNSTSIS